MKGAQEHPDLCIEIAAILAELLSQDGHSDQEAERIALKAAVALRDTMGGTLVYVPKGHHFKLSQRDLQIWSEYDQTNVNQLATAYGLSCKQIYKILTRVRALERERTQPDLFSNPGPAAPAPTPATRRPILSLTRKY